MANKKSQNLPRKRRVRKKHRSPGSFMVCGFDTSMSSIAGAGIAWDKPMRKWVGPFFVISRWQKGDHYFDRMNNAARAENFIHGLIAPTKMGFELEDIYIAQEEPFPPGMVKRLQSNAIKQQAEISGAFLGGLIRYGYRNVFQIENYRWRQIVAGDMGGTIHHKWWTKFRPKEWALNEWKLDGQEYEVDDWPDIIESSKHGKIPRPEGSKAKAVQPDDRYDALAIMEWMRRECWSQLRA